MTIKQINIVVPLDWDVPEILNTLNAEENAFILNMGSTMINEARNLIAGLSQKEIYNKIREESKADIERLELDLLVQKELTIRQDECAKKIYERQVDQLTKQIEVLRTKINNYEMDNKDLVDTEVNKVKLEYDIIIESKNKLIDNLASTYDKLNASIQSQNNKSTSHKGQEGEQIFKYYADETFRDFKSYNLIDKHTQGGSGDFHLQFEEFDILVDAKNYKKKVPVEQRDKIKKDLIKNEHITFAWLVSLNTAIDKYDKAPVMYEWINTKQCIVYINNFMENEDPRKILRMVWYICKELFKFVDENVHDDEELVKLKEERFVTIDKIKNLRKGIREVNTSINVTKNLIQLMDDDLKEMLVTETTELVESNYSLFEEWWNNNIELTNSDNSLLSTDMWYKFKQENKEIIKKFEIAIDKFKQYIKTKVSHTNIIIKSKNSNAAYEIKGIKFKESNNIEKMELILTEPKSSNKKETTELIDSVTKQKKKSKKDSNTYFDEVTDDKIITEYSDEKNDIMDVSSVNNIRPWEVVSLLVKYKLISKRDEARGYDKYKETDEYKNKIVK
jgi:hypothetical protein